MLIELYPVYFTSFRKIIYKQNNKNIGNFSQHGKISSCFPNMEKLTVKLKYSEYFAEIGHKRLI